MQSTNSFRKLPTTPGFLFLTLLVLGATSTARAQNASQQRGFQPGSSYSVSNIETINNQNGNLLLNIPLASLPAGRGGNPGAGVSLIYNSKLWTSPASMVPNGQVNPDGTRRYEERHFLRQSHGGGWRYGFRYQVQVLDRPAEESYYNSQQVSRCPDESASKAWKVRMHFPDGSSSDFVLQSYEGLDYTSWNDGYSNIKPDGSRTVCVCTAQSSYACLAWSRESRPFLTRTLTYYSTDGRYLRLDIEHDTDNADYNNQWTLYTPDGTRVTGKGMADVSNSAPAGDEQYIYDRNNNFIRIQGNRISDQLGRSITIQYDDPAAGGDTITAEGFGGTPLKWTVKWKSVTVHKTLGTCAPWAACTANMLPSTMDYKSPLRVVDKVILPAQAGGLSYTFTYNGNADYNDAGLSHGWGEVASVTLPSGAKASYTYLNDGAGSLNWETVLYNYVTVKELSYLREYDGDSTPATETWLYQVGYGGQNTGTPYYSEVTSPDGGKTLHTFHGGQPPALEGLEIRTVNPDGSMVERIWKENIPVGYRHPQVINSTGTTMTLGGQKPGANTYVKTEFTSVKDAAGNYVRTAIKDYDYDKNGNVTRVAEYDWVSFTDVPRTAPSSGGPGFPLGLPGGTQPVRVTLNAYKVVTPDASDITTDSPNSYHKPTSARLRNRVASTEIRDKVGQVLSLAELTYDDPATTGNLTLQRSWDSTKGALLSPQAGGTRLDAANSVSVRYEYDDNAADPALRYGNLTLAVDASGNRTKYTYDSVARPDGSAVTGLYPTTVMAAEGTGVQRTSWSVYDFSTGLVTKATDEDNQVSTSTTYDALGRPTLVEEADDERDADDVSLERRTVTEYADSLRRVIVRSDLNTTGDGKFVSVRHYDQLGRVRLSRTLEDASSQGAADESAGIKVQARYLYNGQNSYQLVSNPYRAATASAAGGEETMGWAVTTSDQAGRVVRVETFDGAGLPAPFAAGVANANSTGVVLTEYDAEKATVRDQAGKQRRSVSDALGRLARVYEAPNAAGYNYLTTYSYDALGNLTQVAQGAQTRAFTYSSLSRLTSAANPEACRQEQAQCVLVPVTYEYDGNGNLMKKTDPRLLPNGQAHIQITYAYDALNRVTSRTYNDETPDVVYIYDSQTLPAGAPAFERGLSAGRLVAVTYGGGALGTYTGGYDAAGRVRLSRQVTDTGTAEGVKAYPVDYDYYLDGRLKTERYPSGKVYETRYDAAGRVAGVRKQGAGYYAGGDPDMPNNPEVIKYAAHGAVAQLKLGNSLWEHTLFNSRLQPTRIGLGASAADSGKLRLDYAYGVFVGSTLDTAKNNGNIHSQRVYVPGSLDVTQTYEYDEVNRLKAAEEKAGTASTWKQVYSYDQYGNRNLAAGTTYPNYSQSLTDPVGNPVIDTANNRIKISALGQGNYAYDAAGNLTKTLITPQAYRDLTYDAENKPVRAGSGAAAGVTDYYYDGDGNRVKKVSGSVTTIFIYDIGGRVVAEYGGEPPQTGGANYITQDILGSTRIITGQNPGEVRGRYDYLPFGENLDIGRSSYGGYTNIKQRFTGKERDPETMLDYFGARYYTSVQGRFTSPDPLLSTGRPSVPQSWNRYVYTLNNPLNYIDPTGMYEYAAGTTSDQMKTFEAALLQAQSKLAGIEKKYGTTSKEYTDAVRALKAYGAPNQANGVIVQFSTLSKGTNGDAVGTLAQTGANTARVRIDLNQADSGNELLTTIAHEGSHVQDNLDYQNALLKAAQVSPGLAEMVYEACITQGASEARAYGVSSVFAEFSLGGGTGDSPIRGGGGNFSITFVAPPVKGITVGGEAIWKSSWQTLDVEKVRANRAKAISDGLQKDPRYSSKLNQRLQP